MLMTLADEIREFVYQIYIQPARNTGENTVTIRAGDVHEQMSLVDRMPAVCGAIGTNKFENKYSVTLINRRGPTQGANVYFTFDL